MVGFNYTITDSDSSKRCPRFLFISIICNYALLALNILVIVISLTWYLAYCVMEVPVNSVGVPLYDVMRPIDFFLILYYARLALALVICAVSIIILVQTSRKTKPPLLESFLTTEHREIIKVSKSNFAVSLMILNEGILFIVCSALLITAPFASNETTELIAILTGTTAIVLVLVEYVKMIRMCIWFCGRLSYNYGKRLEE